MKNIKNPTQLISIVFSLIFIWLIAIYLSNNSNILETYKNISIQDFLVIVLTYVSAIFTNGYLNKIVIQKISPNVSNQEILNLQFSNNLFNKIFPKGGAIFRGVYLKKVHKLSLSIFYGSFAGIVAINIVVFSVVAFISQIAIYYYYANFDIIILLITFGLLIFSLIIIFIRPNLENRNGRIFEYIRKIIEGWRIIQKNKRDILVFLCLVLIHLLIGIFMRIVIFRSLGFEITFLEAGLLTSLTGILSYINVTPDGIGIREIMFAYLGSVTGLTGPTMVFASVTQRLITFIPSLFFGMVSYLYLGKKINYLGSVTNLDKY
jgi:uncharacterized protein (TIRG00374 family)